MSTGNIEAALRSLAVTHDVSAAMKELDALRKAALVVHENINVPAIPSSVERALRLFEAIAKEAAP